LKFRISNPWIPLVCSCLFVSLSDMGIHSYKASIKMAQAILESGDGNSRLAIQANNHFGIKCHDWTGRTTFHDDDSRNECFRRYNKPEESFLDHSDFLTSRPRYAGLFALDPYDYKAWAQGLKRAGYATDPAYDRKLIRIIEDNQLYKLDSGAGLPGRVSKAPVSRELSTSRSDASERQISRHNRIRFIVAREGDTYEGITREMEMMRWEIARYNDLSSRKINPGDTVYLQPKRIRAEKGAETHIVNQGETMHQISQRYGIRLNRLLMRNHMVKGQEPSPGDKLQLRDQVYRENTGSNFRPVYD
jgi:LysM repeat protein